MRIRTALALVFALVACSPQPGPRPVSLDSGPQPSSAEVCLHLTNVCGADAASCQRKIDQVQADRLTIFPLACWLHAVTPAGVRTCGRVDCPDRAP